LLERILKALNNIKSEVGIIQKHACIPETPEPNETPAPLKFTPRCTDPARLTNFAGVARGATTFVPRSLVNRPMTTVDDETEQTAFMSMVVVQQPVANNNFCIMTLQNNISVFGDYCIRYHIQKSVGEDDGESIFEPMRIPEQIPRMYLRNLPSPWIICYLNPVLALLKPLRYL
jgi:hypothetical protein